MGEGKTVNKEMYSDMHHHLRDGVRMKRPEKWIINSSFLTCYLQGNSPASEFYTPTFWNTVCSIFIGGYVWWRSSSYLPTYEDRTECSEM